MTNGYSARRSAALAGAVGFLALAGAGLMLTVPSSGFAATVHPASVCENAGKHPRKLTPKLATRAIICIVNLRRSESGLAYVTRNNGLRRAAQRHSRRMHRSNCFAHQCLGESDLAGRAARGGYLPCNCSWSLGENIAWGIGRVGSPRRIVDSWMSSPSHRRNILTTNFQELGVGFIHGRPGFISRVSAIYTLNLGYKG